MEENSCFFGSLEINNSRTVFTKRIKWTWRQSDCVVSLAPTLTYPNLHLPVDQYSVLMFSGQPYFQIKHPTLQIEEWGIYMTWCS